MTKKLLSALIALCLLVTIALWQRHRILLTFIGSGTPTPPIANAAPVPGGTPFAANPHFTVVQLDALTYAIAEPSSWARNVNYLILGSERALLFDAGVGHQDIRSVVAALTDLPLTFMPSHFHYDHTGQADWANVAIVDLPHVRSRAPDNLLQLTWGEHLGPMEGIELPRYRVSEWVKPNSAIHLGDRSLVLIYTPGHTDNSVSLLDVERNYMFTGDFITSSGSISALLPTARLGDYAQSSEKVLERTAEMQSIIFRGAHAPPENTIPQNSRQDVQTLRAQLSAIRKGTLASTGGYPVVYQISDTMTLSTEPGFLQNWEPTYPSDHWVHTGTPE